MTWLVFFKNVFYFRFADILRSEVLYFLIKSFPLMIDWVAFSVASSPSGTLTTSRLDYLIYPTNYWCSSSLFSWYFVCLCFTLNSFCYHLQVHSFFLKYQFWHQFLQRALVEIVSLSLEFQYAFIILSTFLIMFKSFSTFLNYGNYL